ncbi:MAG: type II toxin-antitoxin system VapC family toxin [Pseudomonadota bacterium]
MYYCDTSFVAPLVLPEPASDAVIAFLKKGRPRELAVSLWTNVEFASLVSRRLRMGELTERQAELARAAFQEMVTRSYRVLLPSAADYGLAAVFLENYKTGLRAGDALHLAIAKNHGARTIYSLDAGLVKAAAVFKVSASTGMAAQLR